MPPKSKPKDENIENANSLSFENMLKLHEDTIIKFIEMQMRGVNERIDGIRDDVRDLKNTSNFQESQFNDAIKKCDARIIDLEAQMKDKQKELSDMFIGGRVEGGQSSLKATAIDFDVRKALDEIWEKCNDLENRSRRNNLRFDGLEESENESWGDCEAKVQSLISKTLGLASNDDSNSNGVGSNSAATPPIVIERAHRIGSHASGKRDGPRVVIAKFLDWKAKEQVLQAARKKKPKGIFVYEDFSDLSMRRRAELQPMLKKIREEGKFATIKIDRLVVRNQIRSKPQASGT